MSKKQVKKTEPFLKWAGGKSQLLKQFEPLLPSLSSYNRYIEPFIGGGALFFYLQPSSAIIADLNKDLTDAYQVLKNQPQELIRLLKSYQKKHSKEFFLEIRNNYNHSKLTKIEKAAHLIYLNKTCFNGLYRVNKKGEFNVPFGQHKKFLVNQENLISASKALKNVQIKNYNFQEILKYAKKGDFIYLDPPYYPLTSSSNFTSYNKQSFLENEQKQLADVFKQLDRRECLVMLSNSNTDFIISLYQQWNIKKVLAKRFINCMAEKRGNVYEVVIRNYC